VHTQEEAPVIAPSQLACDLKGNVVDPRAGQPTDGQDAMPVLVGHGEAHRGQLGLVQACLTQAGAHVGTLRICRRQTLTRILWEKELSVQEAEGSMESLWLDIRRGEGQPCLQRA
jgi:hypothetical protein